MMVNERVGFETTLAAAIEEVDLFLLDEQTAAEVQAEQRARENMRGAIGMGLEIVGLPGAGGS
jgi:hypothetical protein